MQKLPIRLKSIKAKERKIRKLRKKAMRLLGEVPRGSVNTFDKAEGIRSVLKALDNSKKVSDEGYKLIHSLKRK